MAVARIISPVLLDARGLPPDAWFPVLSSGDMPTPPHYVWVDIDATPSLIWSGHLRLDGRPGTRQLRSHRVRAAGRHAALLRQQAQKVAARGRFLHAVSRHRRDRLARTRGLHD